MGHHTFPSEFSLDTLDVNMGATVGSFDLLNCESDELIHLQHKSQTESIKAASVSEHPATSHSPTKNVARDAMPLVDDILPPLDDRIQTLYSTYQTSYAFPVSATSAHRQHAIDLTLALLQRHYPDSQGYLVQQVPLGPYSKLGIHFELKYADEPDSDIDVPPTKKPKRKARFEDPACHSIEPESMATIVVKRRVSDEVDGAEAYKYLIHTSLVIVVDDLSKFPRFSRANVNHRGDVLTDVLGSFGRVKNGYGMLFFGPRLEFYAFDGDDDKIPVVPYHGQVWKMDMRSTSLEDVDGALRKFKAQTQDVVYWDDA